MPYLCARHFLFASPLLQLSSVILTNTLVVAAFFFSLCQISRAECVPFHEARKHIGETRCVSGKIFRVEQGNKGAHYLDFCEDYRTCPFTVVIFASDLRHVGDVRHLQGKEIEIHGPVKEYDGRAEIILSESRQLGKDGAAIPPLPKNYDVEKKGRYSAGTFSRARTSSKTSKKRQKATSPINIPADPGATDPAGADDPANP